MIFSIAKMVAKIFREQKWSSGDFCNCVFIWKLKHQTERKVSWNLNMFSPLSKQQKNQMFFTPTYEVIISLFCYSTCILLHREKPLRIPFHGIRMLSSWTTPVKRPKSFKWAGFVFPFTLTVSYFPQDTLSLSYLSHMNSTAATQANRGLLL